MTTSTAAALLADAAQVIHGPDEWLNPFARQLGVNPRRLRNWLAGKSEPEPQHMRRAHDLLLQHLAAVEKAVSGIAHYLDQGVHQ